MQSKQLSHTGKRLFLLLLVAALVAVAPCTAALGAEEARPLTAMWRATADSPMRTWSFPWNDEWFLAEDTVYSHDLARCSLGLAISAFGDNSGEMADRDAHIRRYMTQAGFGELSSQQYDIKPSVDTIGTVIGSKRIGDATLIAVAVRGGGYENEWLSNFTVGDETRHVGFGSAAEKVNARIREYLTEHSFTGPIKLWIAGYSRAAAVSNLVAADMTDSGLFADVYAYTFATPRTTKKAGPYPNIFNIVGKFDPVPAIPFAEWGYDRNGVTLYTPAQETDSDYYLKAPKANDVAMQLTGMAFWNNTEINHTLHTIMDYLLGILPTSEVYAEHMQDIMLRLWADKSLPNLSSAVSQLMKDEELITDTQRLEIEHLTDYLSTVMYTTVADNLTGAAGSQWNTRTGLTDNIAHEHVPEVYVSWLFSVDDPAELYTDSLEYVRFVCSGDVTLYIDNEELRYLWQVKPDGTLSADIDRKTGEIPIPLEERPRIASLRAGKQQIIELPRDRDYYLLMEAKSDGNVIYFGTTYCVGQLHGTLDNVHLLTVSQDDLFFAASPSTASSQLDRFTGWSTISFDPWSAEMTYSPSVMALLEHSDVTHLTVSQLIAIAIAAGVLLLLLLAFIIYRIATRKKRKLRKQAKREAKETLESEGQPTQATQSE